MMLSVDEINKLQEENEHWQQLYQNEHCELLQVKEEQRLFTLEAKKLIAQYSAKLEWYKQALQEMRAIAEKTIDIYYPDYYDEGFEEDIVTEFAKQVLDLITKAEEEWK